FEVASATAVDTSAGAKQVSACWPFSSARMIPLSRGSSAICPTPIAGARYAIGAPAWFDNRRPRSSIELPKTYAIFLMIIDCHGHYTTEPKALQRFRKEQTAAVKDKTALPSRASLKISDDEIRESIEQNQLRIQRERGTDLTIFSPRASGMGHHIGD